MRLPNVKSAFINLNKLRNYSLNSEHDRGKHKSRLFSAILGLDSNDAEWLKNFILEAIQIYPAVPTLLDEYGQRSDGATSTLESRQSKLYSSSSSNVIFQSMAANLH
jgi:hypothetical protein